MNLHYLWHFYDTLHAQTEDIQYIINTPWYANCACVFYIIPFTTSTCKFEFVSLPATDSVANKKLKRKPIFDKPKVLYPHRFWILPSPIVAILVIYNSTEFYSIIHAFVKSLLVKVLKSSFLFRQILYKL